MALYPALTYSGMSVRFHGAEAHVKAGFLFYLRGVDPGRAELGHDEVPVRYEPGEVQAEDALYQLIGAEGAFSRPRTRR